MGVARRQWPSWMWASAALALFLVLAATTGGRAVEPDEILKDAALEARARVISQKLRCVVCQNQSIDDSSAPLARDLRVLVRERLVAGDSDRQTIDFIVARYGNFVLLQPPVQVNTLLLWAGPLLLLVLAAIGFGRFVRRQSVTPGTAAAEGLSAEEEARLRGMLNTDGASSADAAVQRAPLHSSKT